jgi:DNA-binding transcriptional regulator YiaG
MTMTKPTIAQSAIRVLQAPPNEMSQEDIAHEIDVSYPTINAWHLNKRRPNRKLLKRLLALVEKKKEVLRFSTIMSARPRND